jgi:hypothetical protein
MLKEVTSTHQLMYILSLLSERGEIRLRFLQSISYVWVLSRFDNTKLLVNDMKDDLELLEYVTNLTVLMSSTMLNTSTEARSMPTVPVWEFPAPSCKAWNRSELVAPYM